jgi:hypothetical protein
MRKFRVRFEAEIEFEVADELLKSCNTDEWRSQMFPFKRDDQFVAHIAQNMVINQIGLGSIDGYADQPKERVAWKDLGLQDWDVEAVEVLP